MAAIRPETQKVQLPRRRPSASRAVSRRAGRRGVTVMETIVAMAIVAAAIVLGVQSMASAARHRRAGMQRSLAAIEAANQLERLMAGDWQGATAAAGEPLPLSPGAQAALPEGEMQVAVDEQSALAAGDPPLDSLKITVSLRWKNHAGEWTAPVSLSGWKHRASADGSTAPPAPEEGDR